MSVSMEGRVAYISGGSCMMARGTATSFLEAGGKVVLGDMKQELLDAAKADLVSKGFAAENIATAIVNVTDWDSIRSSFDQAEAAFGTVDVLVNIAGIIVAYYRLDDMKEEDWDLRCQRQGSHADVPGVRQAPEGQGPARQHRQRLFQRRQGLL